MFVFQYSREWPENVPPTSPRAGPSLSRPGPSSPGQRPFPGLPGVTGSAEALPRQVLPERLRTGSALLPQPPGPGLSRARRAPSSRVSLGFRFAVIFCDVVLSCISQTKPTGGRNSGSGWPRTGTGGVHGQPLHAPRRQLSPRGDSHGVSQPPFLLPDAPLVTPASSAFLEKHTLSAVCSGSPRLRRPFLFWAVGDDFIFLGVGCRKPNTP